MNLYIHNMPILSDNDLSILREKLAIFSQHRISHGIRVGSMQSLLEAFVAHEFADWPEIPRINQDGYIPGDIIYNVASGQFISPGRSPPVKDMEPERQGQRDYDITQQIMNETENKMRRK